MTAAIKASLSSHRLQPLPKPESAATSAKVTPIDRKKTTLPSVSRGEQTVQMMPSPTQMPVWLRSLIEAQQASSILTLVLVAACLSVYGFTVYSQEKWQQESSKLNSLRRDERQLIAANETLKNQIAKLADRPGSGLVQPNSSQIMFLEPAPQRTQPATPAQSRPVMPQDTEPAPLGY
ncbi:hypothetical protein NG798_07410 [Ancylothrix sp. C2]|uniref:hypothetical protein n=1 Tax=Ancylothrix sp. D3o TaxID=2953691 RepID=UPI0021BAED34|nr:hypothetical protein [Ancylothrix sp. D3o]MCT7949610.1 hypothetical protein [Ancylothrix sp. D3o]